MRRFRFSGTPGHHKRREGGGIRAAQQGRQASRLLCLCRFLQQIAAVGYAADRDDDQPRLERIHPERAVVPVGHDGRMTNVNRRIW